LALKHLYNCLQYNSCGESMIRKAQVLIYDQKTTYLKPLNQEWELIPIDLKDQKKMDAFLSTPEKSKRTVMAADEEDSDDDTALQINM